MKFTLFSRWKYSRTRRCKQEINTNTNGRWFFDTIYSFDQKIWSEIVQNRFLGQISSHFLIALHYTEKNAKHAKFCPKIDWKVLFCIKITACITELKYLDYSRKFTGIHAVFFHHPCMMYSYHHFNRCNFVIRWWIFKVLATLPGSLCFIKWGELSLRRVVAFLLVEIIDSLTTYIKRIIVGVKNK